jgi:hypothetical protein
VCQSHRPRIAQAPALKIASVPPQWLRAGRQAKQPGATNRGGCGVAGRRPHRPAARADCHMPWAALTEQQETQCFTKPLTRNKTRNLTGRSTVLDGIQSKKKVPRLLPHFLNHYYLHGPGD